MRSVAYWDIAKQKTIAIVIDASEACLQSMRESNPQCVEVPLNDVDYAAMSNDNLLQYIYDSATGLLP